jgi:hypothetical protein
MPVRKNGLFLLIPSTTAKKTIPSEAKTFKIPRKNQTQRLVSVRIRPRLGSLVT